MKKRYWIAGLCVFMLLLAACQEIPENNPEGHGFSTNHLGTIADSPDGEGVYLFPQLGGFDKLLYYWDMEKDEYTVLCGKVECEHDTEDCNAYFNRVSDYTLQLYKEKLYVWETKRDYSTVLTQIDLDGSNRKELYSWSDTMGYPQYMVMYEDSCYVDIYFGETPGGLSIEKLYELPLTPDEEPVLIMETDVNSGWWEDDFWNLFAHDGGFYFQEIQRRGEDEAYGKFYRYDIDTGKLELIYEHPNAAACLMIKDKLYASIYFPEKQVHKIHRIDPEDGTIEMIFEDGGQTLSYDGTYLYAGKLDEFLVYTLDGTLVDTFECTIEIQEEDLMFSGTSNIPYSTQNYLYFSRMGVGGMVYNLFDKRDIGKEEHRSWNWYYDNDGQPPNDMIGY